MALIVCFAGGIGSAKSSVSLALSERLKWKRTSFGDYLRTLKQSDGTAFSRQGLQNLGKRMLEENEESFCLSVLAYGGVKAGDNGLIDGIRHASVLSRLRVLLAPSVTRLIFLDATFEERKRRVMQREESGELVIADSHSVEAETKEKLPRLADLRLDATRGLDLLVECQRSYLMRLAYLRSDSGVDVANSL